MNYQFFFCFIITTWLYENVNSLLSNPSYTVCSIHWVTVTEFCIIILFVESWKDNPDFTQYLTELSSSNLDRLSKYIHLLDCLSDSVIPHTVPSKIGQYLYRQVENNLLSCCIIVACLGWMRWVIYIWWLKAIVLVTTLLKQISLISKVTDSFEEFSSWTAYQSRRPHVKTSSGQNVLGSKSPQLKVKTSSTLSQNIFDAKPLTEIYSFQFQR